MSRMTSWTKSKRKLGNLRKSTKSWRVRKRGERSSTYGSTWLRTRSKSGCQEEQQSSNLRTRRDTSKSKWGWFKTDWGRPYSQSVQTFLRLRSLRSAKRESDPISSPQLLTNFEHPWTPWSRFWSWLCNIYQKTTPLTPNCQSTSALYTTALFICRMW